MFLNVYKTNKIQLFGKPNKVINHGMYKSCKNGYITN